MCMNMMCYACGKDSLSSAIPLNPSCLNHAFKKDTSANDGSSLSVGLISVCQPVRLSVYLVSVCLSGCPSVCLSDFCLSVRLSFISVRLSVCMSIHLSADCLLTRFILINTLPFKGRGVDDGRHHDNTRLW